MSSTSWTPDEDFNLLLEAITGLDADLVAEADRQLSMMDTRRSETPGECRSSTPPTTASIAGSSSTSIGGSASSHELRSTHSLLHSGSNISHSSSGGLGVESKGKVRPAPPRVLFLITGKGPLRQEFEHKLATLPTPLQLVAVKTLWLEPADYPLVVALADIGVCLHRSTSGLDLPMKVRHCYHVDIVWFSDAAAMRIPLLRLYSVLFIVAFYFRRFWICSARVYLSLRHTTPA